MQNGAKWREERAERSARATRAANARWAAVRQARAGEPVREPLVVEITIRQLHRPMRIIHAVAQPRKHGRWSRWTVRENDRPVGRRALGAKALGNLIASSL
jgi:hypothetical protein